MLATLCKSAVSSETDSFKCLMIHLRLGPTITQLHEEPSNENLKGESGA